MPRADGASFKPATGFGWALLGAPGATKYAECCGIPFGASLEQRVGTRVIAQRYMRTGNFYMPHTTDIAVISFGVKR